MDTLTFDRTIRQLTLILTAALLSGLLLLTGCSSSNESAARQAGTPAVQNTGRAEEPAARVDKPVTPADTVNVTVRNTERPSYEPKSQTSTAARQAVPTGRYSVQLGAYKMPDNAERIASLARERFRLNVYTSYDKNDNLYKVMLGDFASKDDARAFRDSMVQQYPLDYRDAWVSENAGR